MKGCGGYIYGDGVIPIPNYVANNIDISDCFWFIEATTNEDTILLTNTKSASSLQANVPTVPTVRYNSYENATYKYLTTATESYYYYKTTPNYADYYSNPAVLPSPENLPSIVVSCFYLNLMR